MAWQDAIIDAPGGCRLLLEVTPGARAAAFPAGFNPWRGRLAIRVREPAHAGKANDAVARNVADALGVPANAVILERGASDSRKTVFAPIPRAAAVALLAPMMREG